MPVGKKTKLKTKEDYTKDKVDDSKLKETEVLSFEGTIYKENLNKLAYLFYGKDAKNLLEKAIEAFAHLGVKIKVNKEIASLYEAIKKQGMGWKIMDDLFLKIISGEEEGKIFLWGWILCCFLWQVSYSTRTFPRLCQELKVKTLLKLTILQQWPT